MQRTRISAALTIALLGAALPFLYPQMLHGQQSQPTPYSPYPPGILPPDLNTELSRVQGEVTTIFTEAVGQWHALPPLTFTGLPPTLQGTGYEAVRTLGKLMNFDQTISVFKNVACASCHMPYAGFSGPIPSVNLTMIA
jgi:cytochrome c peroxidase